MPDGAADSDLNDECIERIEKDEFIFNLISYRNNTEFERSNILDKKASGVIGFSGIVIGLTGTIISFLLDKISTNNSLLIYYQSFRILLLLGVLFLAGSIFLCLIAFSIKSYIIVPNTTQLIDNYAKTEKNKCEIIQVVGNEISDAIKDNAITDDNKAIFIKYGLLSFAVGMGFIVIFVCGLITV